MISTSALGLMILFVAAVNAIPDNSAQVIAVITSIASVTAAAIAVGGAVWKQRTRSPADENDAARVAREWYRGMLEDAKSEREELRKTIEELQGNKIEASAAIDRLNGLIRTKDIRIQELEDRQTANVEKLRAGQILTLRDILGTDADHLPPIDLAPDMKRAV